MNAMLHGRTSRSDRWHHGTKASMFRWRDFYDQDRNSVFTLHFSSLVVHLIVENHPLPTKAKRLGSMPITPSFLQSSGMATNCNHPYLLSRCKKRMACTQHITFSPKRLNGSPLLKFTVNNMLHHLGKLIVHFPLAHGSSIKYRGILHLFAPFVPQPRRLSKDCMYNSGSLCYRKNFTWGRDGVVEMDDKEIDVQLIRILRDHEYAAYYLLASYDPALNGKVLALPNRSQSCIKKRPDGMGKCEQRRTHNMGVNQKPAGFGHR